MRFSRFVTPLAVLLLVLFSSCKDKKQEEIKEEIKEEVLPAPTKVVVHFNPMWEENDFVMQQVYDDHFGNRIRVDKFMHYLSFLSLVPEEGEDVVLKDFHLMDFFNDNSFEFEVPPGTYKRLKFAIGIPEAYNKDQDPAQYPNSSPLSVAGSQGMFWTWNTGYIFLKFEGKVDTTGTEDGELLWPVAIHIGDDPFYTRYSSPLLNMEVIASETKTIDVNMHIDQILATGGANGVDLTTDMVTHTTNNQILAHTFMDNFVAAITVEQ